MSRTDANKNWFGRALGWITQSVTPNPTRAPEGQELAALAVKSQTQPQVYDDTKQAIDELIKGTIAACITARAQERGAAKFKVTAKPIALANAIQKVLDHPNPVQGSYDFWESASSMYDTMGNAVLYFIKDERGLPAEMYCLPSYYLVAIFDKPEDMVPSAYRWADGRVITDIENLCIIKANNVKTAPYVGRGFIGDQLELATLYDLVCKSQINWFQTGGAPNVALSQPLGSILTPEQIVDIQKMWNQKYNPATGTSNIAILPDGLVPKDFGPAELNLNVSKEEIRDGIREALQTPKIILGDTDNVNLNNGQTALAIFDRTVVLRWVEKVANSLEHYFVENYGSGIKIEVDKKLLEGLQQLQIANETGNESLETVPGKPQNKPIDDSTL